MFTRCPSCRAAFSITQQQLEIAAGMVRCGMCEHVFDAKLFLFNTSFDTDDTTPQLPTSDTQQAPSIDVELSADNNTNIDLEVLDRELHGNESFETTVVNNLAEEEITPEQPAAEPSNDVVIPKIIADQVSNLDKEPSKLNPTQWLGGIAVIALIATVGLQAAAAFKLDLIPKQYQDPICEWIACTLETPRAVDKIEVLNRSIYTHPTEAQALMVTLTVINRAQFSQPYPIIQLRFLNLAGEVIAARQFSANHYLDGKLFANGLMTSSTPVSIQLEVHDVGEEVVSYDFDFL